MRKRVMGANEHLTPTPAPLSFAPSCDLELPCQPPLRPAPWPSEPAIWFSRWRRHCHHSCNLLPFSTVSPVLPSAGSAPHSLANDTHRKVSPRPATSPGSPVLPEEPRHPETGPELGGQGLTWTGADLDRVWDACQL